MDLAQYEQMQPHVQVDGMKFFTPNQHCAWRISSLYTKEPDTIDWIRGMKPGELLFDIGANIGQYSVFAAHLGVKVFAFEPESQNFMVLMRNIAFNGMFDKIMAYPFCISNECKIEMLRLSGLQQGGSCHSFGTDMNYKGEVKQWAACQGSVSFSVDQLIEEVGMPVPDHIKIDVDGLENAVLLGMERTLHKIKSVLVEMDSAQERHMEWKRRLESEYGFETDDAQINAARRTEGPFSGIGNVIFFRKANVRPADNDGVATEMRSPLGTVEAAPATSDAS